VFLALTRFITGRVLIGMPVGGIPSSQYSLLWRTVATSLARLETGNEAVVRRLQEALQSEQWGVQLMAAESLARLGAGNEKVVSMLLKELSYVGGFLQLGDPRDPESPTLRVAESLRQLKIKVTAQSRKVFVAFNSSLHSRSILARRVALMCSYQLLNG